MRGEGAGSSTERSSHHLTSVGSGEAREPGEPGDEGVPPLRAMTGTPWEIIHSSGQSAEMPAFGLRSEYGGGETSRAASG